MKICDLTQFYSPVGGGVKRYVAEKVRFIREQRPGDEHLLIIPGERDEVLYGERSRVYTLRSPLLSATAGYRALLRLDAIERILEREKPDLIESADPYQVAWKALASGASLRIPVIGFYHSHFAEAYLRGAQKYLGAPVTGAFMELARRYVRRLYNRHARTLVPSPALGAVLASWGVDNIVPTDLGVDAAIFQPDADLTETGLRAELGISPKATLLLYVGRLAQEKNTHTLFSAFGQLAESFPGRFHLLVVGDGLQRRELDALRTRAASSVSWISYCSEPERLARIYRAADLFIHPGVQETFGLVTLEAQACGTPVTGIRGTFMDRIVHGDQSLWAHENSVPALAAAIEASTRPGVLEKGDARLLHGAIAARYSWTQTFERLFEVYGEVTREFTPHGP